MCYPSLKTLVVLATILASVPLLVEGFGSWHKPHGGLKSEHDAVEATIGEIDKLIPSLSLSLYRAICVIQGAISRLPREVATRVVVASFRLGLVIETSWSLLITLRSIEKSRQTWSMKIWDADLHGSIIPIGELSILISRPHKLFISSHPRWKRVISSKRDALPFLPEYSCGCYRRSGQPIFPSGGH